MLADDGAEPRILRFAAGDESLRPWLAGFLEPEGIDVDSYVAGVRPAAAAWRVVGGGEQLGQELFAAEALVVETTPVDSALLAAAPRLRRIVHFGSGLEGIDLEACAARGIGAVAFDRLTTAHVAEHALTLLLLLLRRMDESRVRARASREPAGAPAEPRNTFNWQAVHGIRTLAGLRVGVVGMGDIGAAFARRARCLGAQVAYWSRRPRPALEAALDMRRLELADLADWADAVSIHIAAVPELHSLIGAEFLDQLGADGILINTSRGQLVDSQALAEALRSDRLAAAAVDVLTTEPPDSGEPLLTAPRLVMTAHVGAGERAVVLADVEAVLRVLEAS